MVLYVPLSRLVEDDRPRLPKTTADFAALANIAEPLPRHCLPVWPAWVYRKLVQPEPWDGQLWGRPCWVGFRVLDGEVVMTGFRIQVSRNEYLVLRLKSELPLRQNPFV